MKLWQIWTFLELWARYSHAYRILALLPFSGKSQYINIRPILHELAHRGHHVTIITVYPDNNPPTNYEQIITDRKEFWDSLGQKPNLFALEKGSTVEDTLNLLWSGVYFTTEAAFKSLNLQDFIKNDKSHYDLIFTEVFYQESMYMFAHKYKAPIVGLSTFGFAQHIGESMGSPLILPYMTHEFTNFGKKLTFLERLSNLYTTTYDIFWRRFYHLPRQQEMAEKYFNHLPGPLPKIADLERDISIVFINTHFSYDLVRPYVPGIIEIGGAHIKKPKKLPEKILTYLNDSNEGAIFFSLGSNVQIKDMPQDKLKIFLKVFSQLRHRVIMKWEDENLEGKPDNVMIGKWLPQNDILAHPNIKLFITHGGLYSTQEAIYHGVPIIGFPFYGDQFLNMEKVQQAGYGIKVSFANMTEESLLNIMNEVLNNSKYKKMAKELSDRFKDRPISAMDTMIYWMEYVVRHKGASFLKSPIQDMGWFEYHMIDIATFIVSVLIFIIMFVFVCIKILVNFIKNKSQESMHANGKKRN